MISSFHDLTQHLVSCQVDLGPYLAEVVNEDVLPHGSRYLRNHVQNAQPVLLVDRVTLDPSHGLVDESNSLEEGAVESTDDTLILVLQGKIRLLVDLEADGHLSALNEDDLTYFVHLVQKKGAG